MRSNKAVLLALALSLFAVVAFADSITSVAPSAVTQFASEEVLTIDGSGLEGQFGSDVVMSGPAGTFFITPTFTSPDEVIAPIPTPVTSVPGTVTVTVEAFDLFGTRVIGTGSFTVIGLGGQPPLLAMPENITAEATSPSGAVVSFTVGGFSFVDPSPTITCDHASGVTYPIGETTVSCTATDSFGSTSGTFEIFVADTQPPVLTLPSSFTVLTAGTSAVVTWSDSAVDAISGSVTVFCSPASGSTFPLGLTTVRCSATDAHANTSEGSFVVNVAQHTPPTLTLPASFTVEATGPDGATVNYSATATQSATVVCTPPSNTVFNLGTTTVDCTATNSTGEQAEGTFDVTVVDTTPPVLNLPSDITATATSPSGVIVSYVATATDLVSDAVVTCSPLSGAIYPIGTTQVNCTAMDQIGNTSTGSFNITVQGKPVLTLPADITAEATSPLGAAVTFTATAVDPIDGVVPVTCTPASGSTFPLGTTVVTCSATNSIHLTSTGTFNVTIVDTTPPTLILTNVTAEATGPSGAIVTFHPTAVDLVDVTDPVICSPASGSQFALGTTTVQCSSTDLHGNTAHGSFTVTVSDTTPPTVSSITATPTVLWPPNHELVDVTVTVVATDLVDPNPMSQIVSVSSNQPINGTGDGDVAPDWVITGPLTLQLRAERAGTGGDRIYTITVQTTDFSGNATLTTVTVTVPQSQNGHSRAGGH